MPYHVRPQNELEPAELERLAGLVNAFAEANIDLSPRHKTAGSLEVILSPEAALFLSAVAMRHSHDPATVMSRLFDHLIHDEACLRHVLQAPPPDA